MIATAILPNRYLVLVILIVAIIVSPFFISSDSAEAVQVNISTSSSSISPGSSISFSTTVNIQSTERIPIQTAKLSICSDASCSSPLTGSPYLSPFTMQLIDFSPSTGYFTYGTCYGFDSNEGQGYTFSDDRGYGGYSGVVALTYECTVTTSAQWAAGTYFARADIDCGSHTFSSTPVLFTVIAPASGGGSPGGGGTGGTDSGGGSTEQPDASPVATPVDTPTPAPISPTRMHTLTDTIDSEGVILDDVSISFANGTIELQIPANTIALDPQGQPLTEITMETPQAPALLPTSGHLLMVTDLGPSGATFDPPILVSMTYNPDSLPAGASEKDLVLAMHDTESKQWMPLEQISVDMITHTVRGLTSHFTQFAILAAVEQAETPATSKPTETPAESSDLTDIPAATQSDTTFADETPVEDQEPIENIETMEDEDDDKGLNPWVIAGPIIGILFFLSIIYYVRKQNR